MAPMTESVASTALSGSDSNHRSKMCLRELKINDDATIDMLITAATYLGGWGRHELIKGYHFTTELIT